MFFIGMQQTVHLYKTMQNVIKLLFYQGAVYSTPIYIFFGTNSDSDTKRATVEAFPGRRCSYYGCYERQARASYYTFSTVSCAWTELAGLGKLQDEFMSVYNSQIHTAAAQFKFVLLINTALCCIYEYRIRYENSQCHFNYLLLTYPLYPNHLYSLKNSHVSSPSVELSKAMVIICGTRPVWPNASTLC